MQSLYKLHPGFIPPSVCDTIIHHATTNVEAIEATINSTNDAAPESMRKSQVRWIETNNNYLSPFILYTAMLANKEWEFNVDPEVVAIQFTEYKGVEKAHYSWHNDVLLNKPKHRKLSVVIQLSDPSEYEGGDFEFESWMNFNPQDFKQKGSVLVFPSHLSHRVLPVTGGHRYSVVSWLEGAQWK